MADDPQLTEIASRLYGLPLSEFIAARDAETKGAGGSRAVKAFKKSSAGAHLVNLLVRDDDGLLDEIGDLGARLRSAQSSSDAGELRSLDQERRSLVSRSVQAAASLAQGAGVKATEASLRDVEQTVWAALVDAGAFATMRAGTLLRPLSPNGFGSVDLDGASAVPIDVDAQEPPARARRSAAPKKAAPGPATPDEAPEDELRARREAKEGAKREAEEAQAELDAADDMVAGAADAISDSEQRVADLKQELADLRARISEVEDALRDERANQSDLRADLRTAEKARRAAATAAERARRRQTDT